jgi:hypothetical protein
MKASNNKGKNSVILEEDEQQAMSLIVEAILECLEKDALDTQDPFDSYVLNIRKKIHAGRPDYKKCAGNGYRLLLQELLSNKDFLE